MQVKTLWRRLVTQLLWRPRLGAVGFRSVLFAPVLVRGASRIFLGDRVCIRDGARLEVVNSPQATWTPTLQIGSDVNIEQGVHIVCQCSIVIEDQVSITPYCVIVDTNHPIDAPDRLPKIGDRLPGAPSHVRIGTGSFIGTHSVILPGVTIGRGCVIGAGSVVTSDIPDFSIAVGAPARVVRSFDPSNSTWRTALSKEIKS